MTPIPSHASAGAVLEGPGLPSPSPAVSASPLTTSQQLQHREAFSLRSEGSISLQICQEGCFKTIHISEVSPSTYKPLVSHQLLTQPYLLSKVLPWSCIPPGVFPARASLTSPVLAPAFVSPSYWLLEKQHAALAWSW